MRMIGSAANFDLRSRHECPASLCAPRITGTHRRLTALRTLRLQGKALCCCSQNVAEFWSVSIRPIERNGFGKSVFETSMLLRQIEKDFEVLYEFRETYALWRTLLDKHEVRGVQVHDARIAATLLGHGVTRLLTFNVTDFKRYQGLVAIHPQNALALG